MIKTENYLVQKVNWPNKGRCILAQYDKRSQREHLISKDFSNLRTPKEKIYLPNNPEIVRKLGIITSF